ncbi:MAG: hypothetical protein R2809_04945 [Flavobacteriales bacterium]
MGSKTAKMLALTSTLVQLALSIVAAIALRQGNTELLTFDKSWIGPMGIHCAFQIDGINILMALLSGITAPLIVSFYFQQKFQKRSCVLWINAVDDWRDARCISNF